MRAAGLAILFIHLGAAYLGAGSALAKPVPNVFDHKDWIGICDNTLRCTIMGLAADGADSRGYIALRRDGGGAAQPRLTVAVYSDEGVPPGPLRLRAPGFDLAFPASADDQEITSEIKDPAAVQAFARLAAGEAKTVQIAIGKVNVTVSLAGAAAALIWMDDRQGRIGGVTALVRKGPKPASAVPAAPPEPVYTAAPRGSATEIKPVTFPRALLARGDVKGCEKEQLAAVDERGAWRLGPDLILWSVPCTLGAYNLGSLFFLGDGKGGSIRPAPVPPLATPESAEPTADPPWSMVNADFDAKTLMLSAFEKGRGLGDCGVLRNYLWDGKVFQPLEIDYMPECRGVEADAWPALHRGRAR